MRWQIATLDFLADLLLFTSTTWLSESGCYQRKQGSSGNQQQESKLQMYRAQHNRSVEDGL